MMLLVLLQGCSILGEAEKDTSEDLDTLGKDIVDMVEVPLSEQGLPNENAMTSTSQRNQNLYLEQAQERLINVPESVLIKYKQALALMKKEQWQSADKLLDEILVSQPQLSGAYVNKALITFHKKDLTKSNEHLDKALEVNPINPYAHQIKGQVARLNGQFEQAEKSYLKALAIWPDYPEAQINLAILLELYRGRLLDARKYYLSYLVLHPDNVQVQRWLAGIEIKIKREGLTLPAAIENDLSSNVKANTSGEG